VFSSEPSSSVGIATGYGLDGPGIESRWDKIFSTCPDRPWGPSSLLYNGYRVLPGGKERPGRDADPSPPSNAVGHERVELYLYSPYRPYGLYRASVRVQGWPLPLPLTHFHKCGALANVTEITFRWKCKLLPEDSMFLLPACYLHVTYMLRSAACPLKNPKLYLRQHTEFCSSNTLLILISTIIHKCQLRNKLIFVSYIPWNWQPLSSVNINLWSVTSLTWKGVIKGYFIYNLKQKSFALKGNMKIYTKI